MKMNRTSANIKFQKSLSEAHQVVNTIIDNRPDMKKEEEKIHAYINKLANKSHITYKELEIVILDLKIKFSDCFQ